MSLFPTVSYNLYIIFPNENIILHISLATFILEKKLGINQYEVGRKIPRRPFYLSTRRIFIENPLENKSEHIVFVAVDSFANAWKASERTKRKNAAFYSIGSAEAMRRSAETRVDFRSGYEPLQELDRRGSFAISCVALVRAQYWLVMIFRRKRVYTCTREHQAQRGGIVRGPIYLRE